jgi:hypothetical protein
MGMLVIVKDWRAFQDNFVFLWHGAEPRQNPRGKPGSVCFPSNTGRLIHLSSRSIT